MSPSETIVPDDGALALNALIWTLGDPDRAARLLALTGLSPDDLRMRVHAPAVQAATLCFLENYEPDLVACAEAIGATPAALVAARTRLEAL